MNNIMKRLSRKKNITCAETNLQETLSLSRQSSETLFTINTQDEAFLDYFQNEDNTNEDTKIAKLNSRTKIKNFITRIISRKKSNENKTNFFGYNPYTYSNNSRASVSSSSLSDSAYTNTHLEYLAYYF
ncbi:hypothetical protein QEN19_002883 [Hanseniaspora menglaensis]